MNISSVIVIPKPERIEAVVAALNEVVGVDVAAVSPEGKIIVTIETDGDRETVETYEALGLLEGVMSATMVYHQKETDPEAEITLAA